MVVLKKLDGLRGDI